MHTVQLVFHRLETVPPELNYQVSPQLSVYSTTSSPTWTTKSHLSYVCILQLSVFHSIKTVTCKLNYWVSPQLCTYRTTLILHSLKSSATQTEVPGLTSATCVRILSTRASKAEVLKVCCWASCWMSLVNSASLSFMNWPGWHAAQQIHPTFKKWRLNLDNEHLHPALVKTGHGIWAFWVINQIHNSLCDAAGNDRHAKRMWQCLCQYQHCTSCGPGILRKLSEDIQVSYDNSINQSSATISLCLLIRNPNQSINQEVTKRKKKGILIW